MVVSDRFLTALGRYLQEVGGVELDPRLRDWSGTKSAEELVLDADEPEEHEGLDGVFMIDGVVALQMHARDVKDAERRDLLGEICAALTLLDGDGEDLELLDWLNDPSNDRGIGDEPLKVFDFKSDDGMWDVDEKWMNGKIAFAAVCCGS